MSDGFAEHDGERVRDPLRPVALCAGTLAFLVVVFGSALLDGVPRQEVCGDSGCATSVDWIGLLPHPLVLVMGLFYGFLATGLVLGVGLLWRSVGRDSVGGDA